MPTAPTVVADLRAALPSALESRLEGWIDDQIEAITINGVPVTQIAAEIAALGETTLTRFAIDSELVVAGDEATHRLTRLDFTPAGAGVTIALAEVPADITSATTTARCEGGTLTLGDHAFSLPFGQYAWRAIEAAERLDSGIWTAELDASQGLRPAPSTFTGER